MWTGIRRNKALDMWARTFFCLASFYLADSFRPLPAGADELNPTPTEINAFLKADTNKDRVLTPKEFRVFIRLMADFGSKTAGKIRFLRAYGLAFSIADTNRDGILTPLEMRAADNAHGVNSRSTVSRR